jgi:hypothetical protein
MRELVEYLSDDDLRRDDLDDRVRRLTEDPEHSTMGHSLNAIEEAPSIPVDR